MTFAYIQSCSASDLSGAHASSISCTFASNVGAGSLLPCAATADASSLGRTFAFSDSKGSSFTSLDTVRLASSVQAMGSAFCKITSGGADTVTATPGGLDLPTNFLAVEASEYTGSNSLQAHNGGTQTTAGTASSGNMTPGTQPGLIWGACFEVSGSGSAPSAGSGFASRDATWNEGYNGFLSEDKAYTSTAAAAATFTVATGEYIILGAMFDDSKALFHSGVRVASRRKR